MAFPGGVPVARTAAIRSHCPRRGRPLWGGKPATATYSGSAPQSIAGLFQVNVQILTGLTTGVYDLIIKAGNFTSTAGLAVAVK